MKSESCITPSLYVISSAGPEKLKKHR